MRSFMIVLHVADIVYLTNNDRQSQWPRGLRRGSAAERLLGLRIRIPPGACISVVSVVCCQVEVCASGWSIVHSTPTECGVPECDREDSVMRRAWANKGCCDKDIKSTVIKWVGPGYELGTWEMHTNTESENLKENTTRENNLHREKIFNCILEEPIVRLYTAFIWVRKEGVLRRHMIRTLLPWEISLLFEQLLTCQERMCQMQLQNKRGSVHGDAFALLFCRGRRISIKYYESSSVFLHVLCAVL
jgi:hypothetical protein